MNNQLEQTIASDESDQHLMEPPRIDNGLMMTTRNSVPLFPRQPNAGVATLELVNELRDEV